MGIVLSQVQRGRVEKRQPAPRATSTAADRHRRELRLGASQAVPITIQEQKLPRTWQRISTKI